jgi:FMN phosphatase YigB (HAD superfamily)
MPILDAHAVNALVADLIESSRHGDQARAVGMNNAPGTFGSAEVLVAECLRRQGLPSDPPTINLIRRAMAIPVADRMRPLPGAIELLAAIRALGLRTVITSNTYWRDSESYWDDFRLLGMAPYIDAVVTSVDAGHLKPHPAVFEMAMHVTETLAERCVVIGNREENDIEPALALGMRTILVYPDDPKPASSRAHMVAPDLWECAKAVKTMLAR